MTRGRVSFKHASAGSGRMEVLPAPAPREVSAYGSRGVTYQRVARVERGAAGRIRVAPHGVLGRHEAPSRQALLVLAGSGTVSGGEGAARDVRAGDLVVFGAGEAHETRAGHDGLDLLVVEGAVEE